MLWKSVKTKKRHNESFSNAPSYALEAFVLGTFWSTV